MCDFHGVVRRFYWPFLLTAPVATNRGRTVDKTKSELTVVRHEVEPCRASFDVEVPVDRVDSKLKEVEKSVRKSANVPGFRSGKCPMKIIRARFAEEIEELASERLLGEAVKEVLSSDDVSPETSPVVEDEGNLRVTEGQSFVFSFACDIAPEFELPEYRKIQVSKSASEVDDHAVQEVIDELLDRHASYQKVDRPAEENDLLKVTYHGVPVDDDWDPPESVRFILDAEETWVALRAPEIVPGVAKFLMGAEAGETRETQISFPEEYVEDSLAGKDVNYTFNVVEVHAFVLPEFDDEFVNRLGGNNATEGKEHIRTKLESDQEREQAQALRDQVTAALLDGLEFPVPPMLVQRQMRELLSAMYQHEMRQGASQEELSGRTQELSERAHDAAVRQLRQHYVLTRVAEKEQVSVSEDELAEVVGMLGRRQNVSEKVMRRRLVDSGRIYGLLEQIREDKTLDRVVSLAEVTETSD